MHTFAQKQKPIQQTKSANSAKPNRSFFGQGREEHSISHLQRMIGNQAVQRLLKDRTEGHEASLENNPSTGLTHDFSRIPLYSNDRDGDPGEASPKEEPAPKDQPPKVKPVLKTCQLPALAPGFKVTTGFIKPKKLQGYEFGNTARLAAYYQPLKACKENKQWKFSLSKLDVYARVDVQPSSFTNHKGTVMTDITFAKDATIDGTNWKRVIGSLNPIARVKANSSCSGIKYPQKINNYPRRREFWSRKITKDHENYHLAEWTKIYRKELIGAENKLRTLTISDSEASSKADALKKASTEAGKWFPKAYQDATAKYCKTKETDAYNRDEAHYKRLVADIRARAAKEGWK